MKDMGSVKYPKVSVIIPTYNRVKYVCEAIDSVLAQTYPNIEIIVVNDGSSDETNDVLPVKYKGKIVYISKSNEGLSKTRNAALLRTTGKYIAFLDDDDLWERDMLECEIAYMERNTDKAFVYSGALYINEHKEIIGERIPWDDEEQTFDRLLKRNMIISPSLTLVRKSCLDDVGYFDEHMIQSSDYDLFLRLAKRYSFGHIEKKLCLYRVHDTNISKNLNQRLKDHMYIFRKKEIISGINWFNLRNYIACDRYDVAVLFLKDKKYFDSGINFLKAVFYNPFVGIQYWTKRAKEIRLSFLYRICHVYGLIILSFFNACVCFNQPKEKELHSVGQ